MEKGGCIYILTNERHTVLYIGVTSDLPARLKQHLYHTFSDSFTAKYNCNHLIYYQCFSTVEEAIAKEKAMKKWKRAWKEILINENNPDWIDLSTEVFPGKAVG